MKNILYLILVLILLAGCATYRFQRGETPYNQGYVASRDNYVIAEYTLGENNTVPAELDLAKERFSRRRKIVEDYYKKMGYVENRFKMAVYDPVVMLLKFIGGIFRLPFIAVSDYKYNRNPQYKERIDKLDQEKDAQEEERIEALKDKLAAYIQEDLTEESQGMFTPKAIAKTSGASQTAKPTVTKTVTKVPKKTLKTKAKPPAASAATAKVIATSDKSAEIVAVIVAKPVKGTSPLRVKFSAAKSRSSAGKIISYYWDFGDGTISKKSNAVNTYWSGSFLPRKFDVRLTVSDAKGNTATTATSIEVTNN